MKKKYELSLTEFPTVIEFLENRADMFFKEMQYCFQESFVKHAGESVSEYMAAAIKKRFDNQYNNKIN